MLYIGKEVTVSSVKQCLCLEICHMTAQEYSIELICSSKKISNQKKKEKEKGERRKEEKKSNGRMGAKTIEKRRGNIRGRRWRRGEKKRIYIYIYIYIYITTQHNMKWFEKCIKNILGFKT